MALNIAYIDFDPYIRKQDLSYVSQVNILIYDTLQICTEKKIKSTFFAV